MTLNITRRATSSGGKGGLTVAGESGILAYNKGHSRVLSIIGSNGIDVYNGDGLKGKPEIHSAIQGVIAVKKSIPCHVTGSTIIPVTMPGIRYFRLREVLLSNPTVAPDSTFRCEIYTHFDKRGANIYPGTEPLTGLTNDIKSMKEWSLSPQLRAKKRAHPMFHFYPLVKNSKEMYIDIFILGDVLEWETGIPRWQPDPTL